MPVQLLNVSYRAGSEVWLHPMNLSLAPGMNVLLGPTLSGKTTLMRVIAGLDRPSSGQVMSHGRDVTGVPVRQRKLAMVYQQFINYPSLTVYENIASPLRLARKTEAEIKQRVESIAESLRLTPYLDRYPTQLSGGQQQRTALARALAKEADLVLLDEPLVNLDYKLREELRDELAQMFTVRGTTVVYATTEPNEALQLGGHTAVLAAGRLLHHGPTLDLFKHPPTLETARAFSDPPMNELPVRFDRHTGAARLEDGLEIALPAHAARREGGLPDRLVLGIRAHQMNLSPGGSASAAITGQVELAEIGGSETYVHLSRSGLSLIAQLPGVHDVEIGQNCTLHVDVGALYGFDMEGRLLFSPERA